MSSLAKDVYLQPPFIINLLLSLKLFQSWEGRVKAAALILAIPLSGGKGETGQGRACPVLLELKLSGWGGPGHITSTPTLIGQN